MMREAGSFQIKKLKRFGISSAVRRSRSFIYNGKAVVKRKADHVFTALDILGKESVLVCPACPYSAKVFKREGQ